ncbi:MAG: hypothetical protein NVSMB51_00760 [Solirubrobacteraceae bacterium]
MNRNRNLALLAGLVVIVLGFAIASSGSGTRHKATTAAFTVRVVGGKPAGGIAKLAAFRGDTLDLTVQSDVKDEIHIHGYERKGEVAAGGSAHFRFPLSITGVFVVELESRALQIASLEVKA